MSATAGPDPLEPFLHALNDAWQRGDLGLLATFYHPDVVLLPPDAGPVIRGREAVIDTYAAFSEAAELHGFDVEEQAFYRFTRAAGATTMAHVRFAIDYSLDDSRYRDSGLEVYAVIEGAGEGADTGPLIVWRSQTLLNSERLTAES